MKKCREVVVIGGYCGNLNGCFIVEDVDSGEKVYGDVVNEVCYVLIVDVSCVVVKLVNGGLWNGLVNGSVVKRVVWNGFVNGNGYNGLLLLNGFVNGIVVNGVLIYVG